MKLSTRTRYGLRAILELALNISKEPLQLKVIAQRQDISAKYLEQLMAGLKSAGIVRSIRGAKGGYVLAKPPNQIKLSDLFGTLEGDSAITVECVENKKYCSRAADCVARQFWTELQQAVMNILESTTLQDLAQKAKKQKNIDFQI
jgi:Rrf2 family cysteine metabolism transcriptional repressor